MNAGEVLKFLHLEKQVRQFISLYNRQKEILIRDNFRCRSLLNVVYK